MPADDSIAAKPADQWAEKDAFISYCTKDGAWVKEELLPALKANDISYSIDCEHFPKGGDLDTLIETAARRARKTIAILTPAYLESAYCRFENRLLAELDPGAAQRRLVPVLLEPCTLPERWERLLRVEMLKVADRARGLQEVLSAFKEGAVVPPRTSRRALWQLFAEPEVRRLANEFKEDIKRITTSIDDLEGYKKLHDELHKAMEPRRQLELRKAELKTAASAEAWRNVGPPLTAFVRALAGVCQEVEDSHLTDNEWIATFSIAVEVLPEAQAAQNFELFREELERTLFSLDTVPTTLNQLLKLKSEGLRLEELFGLLKTMAGQVGKLNLADEAAALIAAFQRQTDTFAERSKALPVFIAAHAQLQILNNALGRLDRAQVHLEGLKRAWKITAGARAALRKVGPPENGFWFEDLGAREQVLETALAAAAPESGALSDPFSNYMQTLDTAFSVTDVGMRKLLKKLNDFSDEMKDALQEIMTPPETTT